jgi:hypothetical protein
MKSEAKRARRIRKTARKAFRYLVIASAACLLVIWIRPHLPGIAEYVGRFGSGAIETEEVDRYYDLLLRHAPPGKGLVLNLGFKGAGALDKEDLQVAVDRLKGAMGLGSNRIWVAHHDAAKPPAYIKQLGYGDVGILFSKSITERREELNLLVHELGHMYVWKLDASFFGRCDQEKLDDCAGVFLGLGVIMLNGLTFESKLLPGEGYETTRKDFGYLKPGQIGYLLARYCSERGIPPSAIMRFLEPASKGYFESGCRHINRKGAPSGRTAAPEGLYWCPGCGEPMRLDLSVAAVVPRCQPCERQRKDLH